jgi:hypothetical protein
MENQTE